jgi:predicted nucleic acid-binding Zn finger protein
MTSQKLVTRFERAQGLVDSAVKVDSGFVPTHVYRVVSQSNSAKSYVVDLTERTCTCIDFAINCRKSGISCKHILAAELKEVA